MALTSFPERRSRNRCRFRAIALEGSPTSPQSVEKLFPAHESFPLGVLVYRAGDRTRRDLRRTRRPQDRQVLQGRRILLLRGLEHLKARPRERLRERRDSRTFLAQPDLPKKVLPVFWHLPKRDLAKVFLPRGLQCFSRRAATLPEHSSGPGSDYRHRCFPACLKRIENIVDVRKKQAHGFRGQADCKLRHPFVSESVPVFAGGTIMLSRHP